MTEGAPVAMDGLVLIVLAVLVVLMLLVGRIVRWGAPRALSWMAGDDDAD